MSLGLDGETLACEYLIRKGYKIISRNYHSRFGEIDIIAQTNKTLVFVEVKTRTNKAYGTALEAINAYKLRKIIKTSQFYINQFKLGDIDYRFDAIEVYFEDFTQPQIDHLINITV